MNKIKISVVVTSYNHEDYIAQCLDSILMQKGEFELEIVLGDDCSNDNTRKIMEDYQEEYPLIFMLLPSATNLGVTKNIRRCLKACSGEYIAFCEGDDYWTDVYKLQKQFEFLERHPDLSLCFNSVMLYYIKEHRFAPHEKQLLLRTNTISIKDLIWDNLIGNFSCCMYRGRIVRRLPDEIFDLYTVDWMFNMACAREGNIGYIRDWMSVYRIHSKGAWTGKTPAEKYNEQCKSIDSYDKFFGHEYHELFSRLKDRIAFQYCGGDSRNGIYDESGAKISGGRPPFLKRYAGLFMAAVKNPGLLFHRIRNAMRISFSELSTGSISTMGDRITDLTMGLQTQENQIVQLNYTVRNQNCRIGVLSSLVHTRQTDLLVLDTLFPYTLSRFRYEEFNSYLKYFHNSKVLSTGEHFTVVKETRSLGTLIREFESMHPEFLGRVEEATHEIDGYNSKLAYLVFLNNVFYFMEALEKKKIPFIFTLYPGGGFEVNNVTADYKLRRTFSSSQFRKVIVTQRITHDYLIENKYCTKDKIEFIFGGVMPFDVLSASSTYQKKHYGFKKESLDICFAAMKYMPMGTDKGYDIFIEVAEKLAQIHKNIYFHVVGNFNESDVPLKGLEDRITFYGAQKLDWFDKFYEDKDIILSPNIPFALSPGSFDGFPTGSCVEAGLRKVAVFCTDELKLNHYFIDNEEIVIIPHDADKIVHIVEAFYKRPDDLRRIAEKGAERMREVYSYERQVLPRIKLLENEIGKGV